jgi:hypothetical protein
MSLHLDSARCPRPRKRAHSIPVHLDSTCCPRPRKRVHSIPLHLDSAWCPRPRNPVHSIPLHLDSKSYPGPREKSTRYLCTWIRHGTGNRGSVHLNFIEYCNCIECTPIRGRLHHATPGRTRDHSIPMHLDTCRDIGNRAHYMSLSGGICFQRFVRLWPPCSSHRECPTNPNERNLAPFTRTVDGAPVPRPQVLVPRPRALVPSSNAAAAATAARANSPLPKVCD